MNGKSHDDQCCPPSRAQYTCRASRPAIAAQAPACPALPRPRIRARQVPITQFGIQRMIIGLALAAARNGGSRFAWDRDASLTSIRSDRRHGSSVRRLDRRTELFQPMSRYRAAPAT